ncbi:ejaculatory bulb-specific protein 3-like [Cephus cinctus]|uniref:Chemosensory protein 7 n=1 Tax=Cephus cinctus TaxID=211228 RepID=A0A1W6L165_CEPCN|nr:ejaculatory bulb-specific protein 3-like [Cephus cinctus]ARN17838.1 chemosensory protein 7 [Cephus cinctus]
MIGVYVLVLAVIGCNAVYADEFYSNKYDNVNVNQILKSERLLQRYILCLLDKGSCTSDGRFFKEILPEALATNCSKCSMKQREIVKTLTLHLMNNKPDHWREFVEKYDPDNKYRTSFLNFIMSS